MSSCSGPKRPHDRVAVSDMKSDFECCLRNKIGFKGYAIKPEKISTEVSMNYEGEDFTLSHGMFSISFHFSFNFLGMFVRFFQFVLSGLVRISSY